MTEHPGTPASLADIFPSMSRARGVPAHLGTPQAPPTPAHLRAPLGGTGAGGATEATPQDPPPLGLIEVLDALDLAGIALDLDRSVPTPTLVFDPPLNPAAEALIEPVRLALLYVAVGRYTGHAPATCDRCGWVTMLATDERDGTRARCLDARCRGDRVIRQLDLDAVAATRRGQGARAAARTRARRRAERAALRVVRDDDAPA